MTKQGYKTKFIKAFATLTMVIYIFFLSTSKNFSGEAIIGQLIYSAIYMIVPSAVIALIWEFFK